MHCAGCILLVRIRHHRNRIQTSKRERELRADQTERISIPFAVEMLNWCCLLYVYVFHENVQIKLQFC